ncbi:hypothetical protein MHU86_21367 [Fragilaria crotonensis]|nr:hypothetical protein MHU86_21367 [Fragilaria crotonensis]
MLRLLNIALAIIILTVTHAFTTPSRHSTSSSVSTTAVGLFGFFGKDEQNTKGAISKGGRKNKSKEDEPKKPFIFLYGKPQYDWVNNKPMEKKAAAEHTWFTNPRSAKTTKK